MDSGIRQHLLPGEKLVWKGRPATGILFYSKDIFLIPFSLFWCGFVIFWNYIAWTSGGDKELKLFGLLFLIIGIFFLIGRFWTDMFIRKRLRYLVTDQRILILKGNGTTTSKSLDIKHLPTLELAERSGGSGTITFGTSGGFMSNRGFSLWMPSLDPTPQFIRIENVRAVYRQIQRLANEPAHA